MLAKWAPFGFSPYGVAWVLRGQLAILAFRLYVVATYFFSLYYDHVFAYDYLGWTIMLSWETSQYFTFVVLPWVCPAFYRQASLVEGFFLLVWFFIWFGFLIGELWYGGL